MTALLMMFAMPEASVEAIIVYPQPIQIEEAVQRGMKMAEDRQPPNTLYAHFGDSTDGRAHGFLMTKISGVAVMSGHFALRGKRPSAQDIERLLLDEAELQVVVTVFGDTPAFARESYLVLKQGDRLIKPARIRSDARATPVGKTAAAGQAFQAKIVASFRYGEFQPEAETIISVFPGDGGAVNFVVDFSQIP